MKRREDDDCVLLCVRYHRATQREKRETHTSKCLLEYKDEMKKLTPSYIVHLV